LIDFVVLDVVCIGIFVELMYFLYELALHNLVHVGHQQLFLPVLHVNYFLNIPLVLFFVAVHGQIQHQLENLLKLIAVGEWNDEYLLHFLWPPVIIVVNNNLDYGLIIINKLLRELVLEISGIDFLQQFYYCLLVSWLLAHRSIR